MEHEAMLKEIMANLDKWVANAKVKATELKTLGYSPERQAEMDSLNNTIDDLHRLLDRLIALLGRNRE